MRLISVKNQNGNMEFYNIDDVQLSCSTIGNDRVMHSIHGTWKGAANPFTLLHVSYEQDGALVSIYSFEFSSMVNYLSPRIVDVLLPHLIDLLIPTHIIDDVIEKILAYEG